MVKDTHDFDQHQTGIFGEARATPVYHSNGVNKKTQGRTHEYLKSNAFESQE